MSQENYLLANQPSELERLQLQSRVWEPTGRQLLSKVGDGSGRHALDVGCGAMGWLRILSEWVGPSGQLVGTDTPTPAEHLESVPETTAAEREVADVMPIDSGREEVRAVLERVPLWFHTFSLKGAGIYTPASHGITATASTRYPRT
jgi:hypothetical protein